MLQVAAIALRRHEDGFADHDLSDALVVVGNHDADRVGCLF
jgi:hypothetical protein